MRYDREDYSRKSYDPTYRTIEPPADQYNQRPVYQYRSGESPDREGTSSKKNYGAYDSAQRDPSYYTPLTSSEPPYRRKQMQPQDYKQNEYPKYPGGYANMNAEPADRNIPGVYSEQNKYNQNSYMPNQYDPYSKPAERLDTRERYRQPGGYAGSPGPRRHELNPINPNDTPDKEPFNHRTPSYHGKGKNHGSKRAKSHVNHRSHKKDQMARPYEMNYQRPSDQSYQKPYDQNYQRPSEHNYQRPYDANYQRSPDANYHRSPDANYKSPQLNKYNPNPYVPGAIHNQNPYSRDAKNYGRDYAPGNIHNERDRYRNVNMGNPRAPSNRIDLPQRTDQVRPGKPSMHHPPITAPQMQDVKASIPVNPNESHNPKAKEIPAKMAEEGPKPKGAFNMLLSPEIAAKAGGGWSIVASPDGKDKSSKIDETKKAIKMEGIQKGPLRL